LGNPGEEKLSAIAALGTAGSKWRQYWFYITPDKRYTFSFLNYI